MLHKKLKMLRKILILLRKLENPFSLDTKRFGDYGERVHVVNRIATLPPTPEKSSNELTPGHGNGDLEQTDTTDDVRRAQQPG